MKLVSLGILALAAVALLVSGCGGGGGDSTASLSRAEFVRQGNAICARLQEERNEALVGKLPPLKAGEEVSDAIKIAAVRLAVLAQYKEMVAGLKELGVPEAGEDKVEAIIDSMEATVKDVESNPLEAAENARQFVKANRLNQEYGLTSCMI